MVKKLLVLLVLLSSGAIRADENTERVLTLQEISKLDSAFKQILALWKRSRLLKVGESTTVDAIKSLGAPNSISSDGNTWFYGNIFFGANLSLDFSAGRFRKAMIDCKCF